MLYSECHQGHQHHCLHSLKFTSHFVQPVSGCFMSLLCLLTQFTLVVALFVIYQLSCQGVTIVSPSPPVGGTPCRNYKPLLIFLKALYGLKSSGKRWAEVIHGILRDMKVLPSKADPCIWLRKVPNLTCYKYITVYVDDLCIAAESPSAIIQIFKSKYHL